VALAVAAFALSFGANRAAAWGLHPIVLGLAVLLPLAVWALVRIERKAEAPIIPLHLLELRDIRAAGAASFFMNGSHMSSFLVTPLLLLTVFGYSATATSLLTLARTLSISLSAPIASRVGMRIGERQLAVVATVAMAGGMAALGVGAGSELIAVVLLSMVLSGFAFGHGQPSVITIAGNAVDAEHFGLVTSLQQTAGQIGGVTAMGAAAAIIGDRGTPGTFASAYAMAAVLAVIGAVAAAAARGRTRRIAPEVPGGVGPTNATATVAAAAGVPVEEGRRSPG
jgi:predicted MFS family arabinose efflux permease